MAELKTVADFENYILNIDNRMVEIANEMDKIKNGVGKAIVKRIQETALKLVGININLPDWSVWFSAGAIGIVFSQRERNKLKPFIKELDSITFDKERALNELISLGPKEAAENLEKVSFWLKSGIKFDPVTGTFSAIEKPLMLDNITEATGVPKLLRNLKINPMFAYLVYPVGAYVGFKVFKKSKRRKK